VAQLTFLKITQDKTWINDDDLGVKYTGYWEHKGNRSFIYYNVADILKKIQNFEGIIMLTCIFQLLQEIPVNILLMAPA